MRNGSGFANAAGLNNDIVEPVLAGDVAQLLYKIHLQGAADATILQGHQVFVFLSHNASFFNQLGIDVHFADIVDDNGKLNAALVGENAVEQCCFSAAQITREQQYGNGLIIHVSFFLNGVQS